MKNIYFVILVVFVIIYIVSTVKKGKFSIQESFFWILGSFIMFILALFPKILDSTAKFIGVDYPPSLLFVLCIIFLLTINFRNGKRIAEQKEQITDLAQNIAILKSKEKE